MMLTRILLVLAVGAALGTAQNDRWSSDFNLPGVVGQVRGATVFRGDLAAIGADAGHGSFLNGVGLFDGTSWRSLPGTFYQGLPPFDIRLDACVVFQNDLIVAGRFTAIGGSTSWGVARWNGTAWQSFGGGLGEVHCLCVHNGELYAGGSFDDPATLNPVPNRGLARWTGTTWVPVGGLVVGPQPIVHALHSASDGTLWAAGFFDGIGAVLANNVARWNGAAWQALGANTPGGGVPGTVLALAEHQGQMIVGGSFAGAGAAVNLAAWNGSAFVGVGPGANDFPVGVVEALHSTAAGLVVGGDIFQAGGGPVAGIARFDGAAWHHLGGLGAAPGGLRVALAFADWNGRLVVGGEFERVGGELGGSTGRVSWNIAAFDGLGWDTLGEGRGCGQGITRFTAWRGGFVAVGNVGTAGSHSVSRATWFDGREHRAIAEFDAPLTGVGVFQGDLVVSGTQTTVNGLPATRTMRFDGQTWTPLGNVLATDFAEYQGQLHAAAGGISVWTGTTWAQVGGMPLAEAWDLEVFQGRLVVAGRRSFFQNDYLFDWDGTTMRVVPNGPDSTTRALAVMGNELWIGGDFARCGAVATARVARWNGASFMSAGAGIAGPAGFVSVQALAALDGRMYVGGSFNVAGGAAGNGIVVWDGAAMRPLGDGVQPSVGALWADPLTGDLLVGGDFFAAGGRPSANLARYRTRDGWTDLGNALAGQGGAALLTGHGQLRQGETIGLRLVGVPAGTFGLHVVGLSRIDVPLLGGVLVPSPAANIGFLAAPIGSAELSIPLVRPVPTGTTLFVQSWFFDGLAPQGIAASNAVSAVAP